MRVSRFCLSVALLCCGLLPVRAADPVAELQEALRVDRDPMDNAKALAYRKALLMKRAEAVRDLDDRARALLLQEWTYDNQDPSAVAVETAVWEELADRFEKAAREVLKGDDPLAARALLALLGESTAAARALGSRPGLWPQRAVKLAPDVVRLTESPDVALQTGAARALSRLSPEPDLAVPPLARMLQKDSLTGRRAAVQALLVLVQTAHDLEKRQRTERRVDDLRGGLIALASTVTPVAGGALSDADAEVQRTAGEAIRAGAAALDDLVVIPASVEFPPVDRELAAEERQRIKGYAAEVEAERKEVAPLARALAQQLPALNKALTGRDLSARLAAHRALERIADVMQKLSERRATVPRLPGEGPKEQPARDPLMPEWSAVLPTLTQELSDGEVRVRVAALYVVESLDAEAAPAAASVAKAAQDSNPFVRWGVARVLGKLAPREAGAAVPALARLLTDDMEEVRLTAAAGLKRYGPAAKDAVPALGKTVEQGDKETRKGAIGALEAVGPEARAAAPALVKALGHEAPEIRTAAAVALGAIGNPTEETRTALLKALDDTEGSVRRAAGGALLKGRPKSP